MSFLAFAAAAVLSVAAYHERTDMTNATSLATGAFLSAVLGLGLVLYGAEKTACLYALFCGKRSAEARPLLHDPQVGAPSITDPGTVMQSH